MNRFQDTRKKAGYTQVNAAKLLGISRSTLAMWETGKTQPDNAMLTNLAELYRTTVDYLLGIDHAKVSHSCRVPVLGSIPAGIPMDAIEDIVGWEDIPSLWVSGNRDYFALLVKGDSMWPEYLPGDTIIVRKQSTFENGDDCVIYINGYNATLKRLYRETDGCIRVVPINQSYPPRTYTPEEVEQLPVSCAGVVVELRRTKKK